MSHAPITEPLVSTDWLTRELDASDLRVLDASWYMPADGRDTGAEFKAQHIPGAAFFDIDANSDETSDLPHMVPPVEKFISRMKAIGIGDGNRVVIYDTAGIFSSARVWWLFRLFGHRQVAVLDGGLPKWLREGGATDKQMHTRKPPHLGARQDPGLLRDADQVAAALQSGTAQVLDARASARFKGEQPEPWPGLRAGHMPGARNLYFKDLLQDDGTMKPIPELRTAFLAAGIDLDRPVITTCGSGVTAAVLSLGLERLGHKSHSLYDGSWSEWGMEGPRPVVKG